MLVKVSLDELYGAPRLGFDLYEGDGLIRFPAGIELTQDTVKTIRHLRLYRHHEQIRFNHEGFEFPQADVPLSDSERVQGILESEMATLYSESANSLMFDSIGQFWEKMNAGATPDVALCELVRDQLVSELTHKSDQIHALTQLQVRDGFTYSHTLHVAALSVALALKMGYDEETIREIGLAAILHDLGKFMIPKHIMFKPGRLTEKEFEVMKLHPRFGHKIILDTLKLPQHIARPALEHQEMHGGGGYPQNLTGDEIHPYSQIVKVADVYEALTARRPYKDPIPSTKALQIMQSEGAKSFNPVLLDAFAEMANFVAPEEPDKQA